MELAFTGYCTYCGKSVDENAPRLVGAKSPEIEPIEYLLCGGCFEEIVIEHELDEELVASVPKPVVAESFATVPSKLEVEPLEVEIPTVDISGIEAEALEIPVEVELDAPPAIDDFGAPLVQGNLVSLEQCIEFGMHLQNEMEGCCAVCHSSEKTAPVAETVDTTGIEAVGEMEISGEALDPALVDAPPGIPITQEVLDKAKAGLVEMVMTGEIDPNMDAISLFAKAAGLTEATPKVEPNTQVLGMDDEEIFGVPEEIGGYNPPEVLKEYDMDAHVEEGPFELAVSAEGITDGPDPVVSTPLTAVVQPPSFLGPAGPPANSGGTKASTETETGKEPKGSVTFKDGVATVTTGESEETPMSWEEYIASKS